MKVTVFKKFNSVIKFFVMAGLLSCSFLSMAQDVVAQNRPDSTKPADPNEFRVRTPDACIPRLVTYGSCSFVLPETRDGAKSTAVNTEKGLNGEIHAECKDSDWNGLAVSCFPSFCKGGSTEYNGCVYNLPDTANNHSAFARTVTAGSSGAFTAYCGRTGSWKPIAASCYQ